ncbi:MAG: hypothetical protein L3J14_07865 [Flavobacteriaceae bacterium]|nr:hypothetical protein [Flavobacteriaceae bacterium]
MAQNIKDLLKNESEVTKNKLPEGHKMRFENRLDNEFPKKKNQFSFLRIAASFLILMSLAYAGFNYLNDDKNDIVKTEETKVKSLANVSPELKKVEEFYLAQISYQISKIKISTENKDLLAIYLSQLSMLQQEYKELNLELNTDVVSEVTIGKLIENLQLRLQLLRELKKKLKLIEDLKTEQNEPSIA